MANNRNRNTRIVRRALARRKRHNVGNSTLYLNNGRGSIVGGKKSFRTNKFDFTLKDTELSRHRGRRGDKQAQARAPKTILHPEPWHRINDLYPGIFESGNKLGGIVTPEATRTRNVWDLANGDGSECKFRCNNQDIWVAPGDCIRCPENAYCPDNMSCRPNGSGYFDYGWACCGCRAQYDPDASNLDPNGPNADSNGFYGKKLGQTYTLWSGDNDCDDGRWCARYYASRRENNYISPPPDGEIRDQGGTDNNWNPNQEQFYSGPWNYSTEIIGNLSSNYLLHHMFYWADNQPNMEQDYFPQGTMIEGGGPDIGLMGSTFPHMACAEWGYDCGDVLNKCPESAERSGCGRLAEDTAREIHTMYPNETWGSYTDDSEFGCNWGDSSFTQKRRRFLGHENDDEHGYDNDPNYHCGWVINRGATCKGKCNRAKYLNRYDSLGLINPYFIQKPGTDEAQGIGWDPGGVSFTTGNVGGDADEDGWSPSGPEQCFCDYSCYYCGCDYGQIFEKSGDADFALESYTNCLRNCSGDCYGPNHIADGFESGFEGKVGSEPGVSCDQGGGSPGDCCGDWRGECYVPRPKLPCECYDIVGNAAENGIETGFPDGQYVEYTGTWFNQCQAGTTSVNCTSNTVMEASDADQCSRECNTKCVIEGWSLKSDAWERLLTEQEITNNVCVMDWWNENILEKFNRESFVTTPSCNTVMHGYDYNDGSCTCSCKCATDEYNLIFNPDGSGRAPVRTGDNAEEADLGCGGFLPDNLSPDNVCNYEGVDSRNYNCSVEYIESLGSAWYTGNIPFSAQSRRCTLVSTDNYLTDPYSQGDSVNGIIPKRVVQLYTLIQAYIVSSECSLDDYTSMLNGTINACSPGYDQYLSWWSGFEKGCTGCADRSAGNYTGNVIKNAQGLPMDCSGDGTAPDADVGDTTCCYDESGCGDSAAINYLTPGEAQNELNVFAGGLGSLNPDLVDQLIVPMTSSRFCEILWSLFGGEMGEEGSCLEAQYHFTQLMGGEGDGMTPSGDTMLGGAYDDQGNIQETYMGTCVCGHHPARCGTEHATPNGNNCEPGFTPRCIPEIPNHEEGQFCGGCVCEDEDGYQGQDRNRTSLGDYVYCFAPNGCANYPFDGDAVDPYCSYDTIDYCADNRACNYSISCAQGQGDNSCPGGSEPGYTCVDGTAVMCGSENSELCMLSEDTGKVNFCRDSDGDCLTDVDEEGVEIVRQAIGCNMSFNPATSPDDSKIYYQSQLFQTQNSNTAGYELTTQGADCPGGILIDGPNYNGYPLAKCNVNTESSFDYVDCPSNMTHANQGDGERYCTGIGNIPSNYPFWNGEGSPKVWHGQPFDINHCCALDITCFSGGNSGVLVNGVELPCCYRDDDCGNCNLPNQGIFVMTDSGAPQDGGVPEPYPNPNQFDECALPNVGGGMGIWDYSDSVFGIARGTAYMYEASTPNISFCSCDTSSALGCNCNNASDNDAGLVCTPVIQERDCNGDCDGDAQPDECGVCNGPGYISGCDYCDIADTCCPENSPACEDNNYSQCGVPDCNYQCGGTGIFTEFAQDMDGDGFCNEQTQISYCSTGPDDYPNCDGTCPGVYIPISQCDPSGWDANDDPEEGYCPSNNFDDCNICIGLNGHEANSDQDCAGVCFGSNQLDECGVCACPTGLEDNCGDNYNTWNSTQDQCGICQGDTLMSKDILGMDVELTWGSFGCTQQDWYANFESSDQSGGTCGPLAEGGNGILHCGCQCAGCTNMASPAWTPHAKYPEIQNTQLDWLMGDPAWRLISGQSDTQYLDYCWDYLQHNTYEQAREAIDILYDRFGSYCSEVAYNTADGFGEGTYRYCMFFDSNLCVIGDQIDIGCTNPNSLSFSNFFEDVMPAKGWKWHGNLQFVHCSNPAPGPQCDGGDTQCVQNHGTRCCGQHGGPEDEHCRFGVRSELYWEVQRGDDGDSYIDWNLAEYFPDVNQDGSVNILDVVQTVNYILENISFTPEQVAMADSNGDGIINILDVIQIINLIMGQMESGGLVSRNSRLSESQTDLLTRNLLPLFNNSVYTKMMLLDSHGLPVRNNRNNRENQTRTEYNFDYFSFLINAPTCISEDVQVEIGGAFGGWGDVQAVPAGNGLMSVGVISNNQGSVTVGLNEGSRPLVIIYHANVHIQADTQYKQVGTITPNNLIKFIPSGTTAQCTAIDIQNGDHLTTCASIMDLMECNSTDICEVIYVSGTSTPPYEIKGIFGYDFATWNPDTNCPAGNCIDNKHFWLPGEREEILITQDSCDN